ncbi:enoyl-CoA hydratase/isomerase family protein [Streptomyces sp. NBC_00237]|uniref:enoyl-CoA hydratase/isomerase family protein n=1 Tax=Streptomyces sp. NBC_00237 TaxID=2975687 RepID=UPI002250B353|nr:enoyl-CoA hydratase/isomerase family protein [Streptomyces sp. NBC_00237]MCX5203616.1 enoyl-CoA hydratase/isomerase family protein [Streptomyces sp. NBC_00237]
MDASGDAVLCGREGRAATLVLNRPRALNALNHEMVRALDAALTAGERDPAVETVVLTGAGERGLCAGGDIRSIYEDARSGDSRGSEGAGASASGGTPGSASAAFWRDEYRLNSRIARYPKPYVALMDGIVMGGGVGVSAHGSVRIVSERSRIAMPETGIGFVPDVGGTYLLALAPGELGTHVALAGVQLGARDALLCGLADHFVPQADLPRLRQDLALRPVRNVLTSFVRQAPPGELAEHQHWIDACYSADTVEEIVSRLRAHGSRAAAEAADTLATKSPTALKVTLTALRGARELGPLERVLEQEYRVSCAALTSYDLVEGIRAQVIDKDRRPRWRPASLSEVTQADVARYFAPPPGGDLSLSSSSDSASQEVPW